MWTNIKGQVTEGVNRAHFAQTAHSEKQRMKNIYRKTEQKKNGTKFSIFTWTVWRIVAMTKFPNRSSYQRLLTTMWNWLRGRCHRGRKDCSKNPFASCPSEAVQLIEGLAASLQLDTCADPFIFTTRSFTTRRSRTCPFTQLYNQLHNKLHNHVTQLHNTNLSRELQHPRLLGFHNGRRPQGKRGAVIHEIPTQVSLKTRQARMDPGTAGCLPLIRELPRHSKSKRSQKPNRGGWFCFDRWSVRSYLWKN